MVVTTEAELVPFYFYKQDSNNSDNVHIDTAQSVLPGFAPGDCITAHSTVNSNALTATTTYQLIEKFLSALPSDVMVKSLTPPLWGLSQLYSRYFDSSFVLWKFSEKGSVAGYVENGTIVNELLCWVGSDDLETNPDKSIAEIDRYVKSLIGQNEQIPIMFYPEFSDTENYKSHQKSFNSINIPDIKDVPPSEHELFALATSDDHQMNFVPFERASSVGKILKSWQWIHNTTRVLFILISSLILVILSSIVFQKCSHYFMNDSLIELNALRSTYTIEKDRYDSLKTTFLKNAGHIQKESTITNLLNDLQNVFPEGMWAEEITIIENGESTWKLTIRALSNSNGLLPIFNSNFKNVSGTKNHRVIYSENTTVKNNLSAIIRIKVECDWR
jgi:hypothetical protein